MKDWLNKLAEQTKSDDEVLHEQIQNLSPEILQELAYEFDPSSRPSQLDAMAEKIAQAEAMGRELAHEKGGELIKEAGILSMGLGALKGFATGGPGGALLGAAKAGVTDAVSSGIKSTVSRGVSSAMRPSSTAASGGFNYGKVAFDLKGLGRMAAGAAYRHPGAALTLAGAGVGAMMAPRDPQTGQKQYLRGAMMGGGLAAGAHALSDGRLGNAAKKMVTRQNNPVLGQGARRYMIESAAQTRPGAGGPAAMQGLKSGLSAAPHSSGPEMSSMSPQWASAHRGVQEMQGDAQGAANMFAGWQPSDYRGGPTMGNVSVKKASVSSAGLILRAALMQKMAAMGGAGAMFSTKLSPAKASGAVMGGGMKGLQSAAKAATPPPVPARRMAGGTGTFAAPAGPSPFAAPPRQAPARPAPAAAGGGGLGAVQSQLNSARSVAGGGPMMPSGGGATIRAMPGSGW